MRIAVLVLAVACVVNAARPRAGSAGTVLGTRPDAVPPVPGAQGGWQGARPGGGARPADGPLTRGQQRGGQGAQQPGQGPAQSPRRRAASVGGAGAPAGGGTLPAVITGQLALMVKGTTLPPGAVIPRGRTTMNGKQCFVKRDTPTAPKEREICLTLSLSAGVCDGREPLRRAFRSVLSYAVAKAVRSTVILEPFVMWQNGAVVGNCLTAAPAGSQQPRRAGANQPYVVTMVDRSAATAGKELKGAEPVRGKKFIWTNPVVNQFHVQCMERMMAMSMVEARGIPRVMQNMCTTRCSTYGPIGINSRVHSEELNQFATTRRVEIRDTYPLPDLVRSKMQEMQLLDAIAGQCDRHSENYFVTATGVFGIDLDMSWGSRQSPYGDGNCKLVTQAPFVDAATLARFQVLQNGGLEQIIDIIGKGLKVPPAELTPLKAAAKVRLTTVMADATRLSTQPPTYTSANSLWANNNEVAKTCSDWARAGAARPGAGRGNAAQGNQPPRRVLGSAQRVAVPAIAPPLPNFGGGPARGPPPPVPPRPARLGQGGGGNRGTG